MLQESSPTYQKLAAVISGVETAITTLKSFLSEEFDHAGSELKKRGSKVFEDVTVIESVDQGLEKIVEQIEQEMFTAIEKVKGVVELQKIQIRVAQERNRVAGNDSDVLHEENANLRESNIRLDRSNRKLQEKVKQLEDDLFDLKHVQLGSSEPVFRRNKTLELLVGKLTAETEMLRQAERETRLGEEQSTTQLEQSRQEAEEYRHLYYKANENLERQLATIQSLIKFRTSCLKRLKKLTGPKKGIRFLSSYRKKDERRCLFKRSYIIRPIPFVLISDDQRRRRKSILTTLDADIQDATKFIKAKDKISDLETYNQRLKMQVEGYQAQVADLEESAGKSAKLTAELRAKASMVDSLRRDLTDSESRLIGNQSVINDLSGRLKALNESIKTLRTENEFLRHRVDELTTTGVAVSVVSEVREIAKKKSELTKKESEIQKKESEIQKKESEIKKKESATKKQVTLSSPPSPPSKDPQLERKLVDMSRKIESLTHHLKEVEIKHRIELEKIQIDSGAQIRRSEAEFRAQLERDRQKSLQRIFEYQRLIGQLEDKVVECEGLPVKPRVQQTEGELSNRKQSAKQPLPEACHYSLILPSVSTSVSVPIQTLSRQQHDELVIHVSLPPQRLRLFYDEGVFRLDNADTEAYQHNFIANMSNHWKGN